MADSSTKGTKSVEFSLVESENVSREGVAPRRGSKGMSPRRSSFFQKLSQSFRRSGGERGADVATLRGQNGPDFEANAIVSRGGAGVNCGCFGKSSTKERLILIKGPFVFVYSNESSSAPNYAIRLAHMKASFRGASGGRYNVTLETNLGDVEYEFSFQESTIANQFVDAVKRQAAAGETELARKRLGHEHLLNKRASVRYAEQVAMKKIDDQPAKEERLTVEERTRVAGIPVDMAM